MASYSLFSFLFSRSSSPPPVSTVHADLTLRERLITILLTSHTLHQSFPEVLLRALLEAATALHSEDDVRAVVLDVLCSSHLPDEIKADVMEQCLNEEWDQLTTTLNCATHPLDTYGNLTEANFERFRAMVVSVFTRSRKVQSVPVERLRQLGALLHSATSIDELMELTIRSLQQSVVFTTEDKEAVMNDILDKRYDLLLRPNRFDCGNDNIPLEIEIESEKSSTLKAYQEQELDECPVCLGVEVVDTLTPCGHEVCMPCLRDWSRVHGEPSPCPLCRTNFSIVDCTPL